VVKSIDNITSHVTQAIHRLPEKNKDTPGNWDSLIGVLVNPAQDLEDIMQSMLDERSITTSEGVNLDRLGEWVGEPRLGRTDADFLLGIYGKISENNSEGTEKDVMLSVKRFVTADSYVFEDAGEARFKITLTNPTYPTDPRLYASIEATKVAGVGYTEFTTTPINYYGFSNDTGAKGLSTIVNTYYPFYFSDEYLTPSQEIGVYESGGDYVLRMAMKDGPDALTFENQLIYDYVDNAVGNLTVSDAEGIVWNALALSVASLSVNATPAIVEDLTGLIPDTYTAINALGVSTDLFGFPIGSDALLYQATFAFNTVGSTNDTKVVVKLWRAEGSVATLISTSNIAGPLSAGTTNVVFTFDTPVQVSTSDIVLFSLHVTEGTDDVYAYSSTTLIDIEKYGLVDGVTGTYSTPPTVLTQTPMCLWKSYLADDETRVMELALTSSSGATQHCSIFKNGVPSTMADFLSEFAVLNTTTLPVFNHELMIRSSSEYASNAGYYSTLLPRS
jgi:hypothetical protein